MASGRARPRPHARPQGQERLAECRCRVTRYARCGVCSAFMTERDGPMTPKAFHALFGRIGARAKMQFPIHPHMLRQRRPTTHGRYRLGSATRTSSTRCVTPSWPRIGLGVSGDRSAMDALRAAARRGPPSLAPRRLAAAKAALVRSLIAPARARRRRRGCGR